MNIKIENFRIQNNANVLALFDIYLEKMDITFRNWKLLKSKKGAFVCSPAFCIEQDGQKTWIPYVDFGSRFKDQFLKNVLQSAEQIYHDGTRQLKGSV